MYGLLHERMVGNLDVAAECSRQAVGGKNGGQQVIGAKPLQVGRHGFAAALPRHRSAWSRSNASG